MHFSLVVHGHQPPGNFDSVFQRAVESSYRPFFEALAEFPDVRISAHLSGSLLEWLERHRPDVIETIRKQVERGQVEPVTAGLYEPVLALIPPHDRVNQVLAHRALLQRLFGTDSRVAWLTERVWMQELAGDLARAGIEAAPLDDRHFLSAGVMSEALGQPYRTEYLGSALTVVPGSEEMRMNIPWRPVNEVTAALRRHAAGGTRLLTFADDLEKFGLWPGTYRSVFQRGWLRRFLGELSRLAQRGEVELTPLGEALRAEPPRQRVYLPDGSYPEMLQWTLPPAAQRAQKQLRGDLEAAGMWQQTNVFLRAGTYLQFLAKYPEVNHLHKRMLDVSRRVAARHRPAAVARSIDDPPEAVRELWRAQANCAYWHGLFGGTYLPFLRQTLYRHLLRAERALEADGEPRRPLRVLDLDGDMHDEALLTNDALTVVVASGDGGAIVELSDRERAVNLGDTLARREEAYHGVGPDAPYRYDRGRRGSFGDRFLQTGAPPERSADIEDLGDFEGQPYAMVARRLRDGTMLVLTREGAAPGGAVRVKKTLRLADDSRTVRAEYQLTGVEGEVDARFGVEQNLAVFSAEYPAGEVRAGARTAAITRGLAVRGTCALDVLSEEPAVQVTVASSRPADIDVRPIGTVSQSEGGFEQIRQGLACLFTWPVRLAPGERFEVSVDLTVHPPGKAGA